MKPVEIITYSLRADQERSDSFYRDLEFFTDEVLLESTTRLERWICSYQDFLQKTGAERLRTAAEYTFELLCLGVLWRVYAGGFVQLARLPLAPLPQRFLANLAHLRDRHPRLKPPVDFLRGWLMALVLSSDQRQALVPDPRLEVLDRLLEGLSASGNYDQVVNRLENWRKFMRGLDREAAGQLLASGLDFAAWFEQRSNLVLGQYTLHVDQYLKEKLPSRRGQQDYIFCGRKRVEYHLNMVGTEILNRSFRLEFLQAKSRVVVVPPCMRAPSDQCKAKPTPFGERCAACTPGCRVNQLTKLGEKHGFQVFILPDELKVFSTPKGDGSEQARTGIVGISCVLTNAPGGWDMKDLGVPAQGVFLDYCGCSYHWHKEGIPTDINFHHLLRVIQDPKTNSSEGTAHELT